MKQISVFIENSKGKLAEVTSLLADKNVDLRALSIADTADYGILRIIADETDRAEKILTDAGFVTKISDVIGVDIEDRPGSFARVVSSLGKAGISLEYAYAFTSSEKGRAFMAFRVNDAARATDALKKDGVTAII
jgi:hypothetical protein